MSSFAKKILLLRQDLPSEFDIDSELEAPWLSQGPVLDHFSQYNTIYLLLRSFDQNIQYHIQYLKELTITGIK